LACGLAPERVRHIRNGIRHFASSPRTPSERVRIGYIGAIHAHKGIDLLVRAFQGLGDRASLHVHGTPFGSPVSRAYAEGLHREAGPGTHFLGPYDNARIGEVLASLDLIVVPSLWYENSPLTIQEAFHGGVPVVTADVGGMAELVRHEVDGLHFRFGDEESLRVTLRGLVDHPKRIAQLRANIAAVPSIGEQAVVVRRCYEELAGDT
jgi:glycosyltransferase involved in cell wall biosynthesis